MTDIDNIKRMFPNLSDEEINEKIKASNALGLLAPVFWAITEQFGLNPQHAMILAMSLAVQAIQTVTKNKEGAVIVANHMARQLPIAVEHTYHDNPDTQPEPYKNEGTYRGPLNTEPFVKEKH